MAIPLHTIPNWVPNIINPKILFITENYPGDPDALVRNSFFYRTLNTAITVVGSNNLLNNLCKAMGIPGAIEREKLDNFMNDRKYFLIDTFPSGEQMSQELIHRTIGNPAWVNQIIDDIEFLNPQQIVFTCVGSNGVFLPLLEAAAMGRGLTGLFHNVIEPIIPENQRVFKSPSNRWFHDQTIGGNIHQGFNSQIQHVINNGNLIP